MGCTFKVFLMAIISASLGCSLNTRITQLSSSSSSGSSGSFKVKFDQKPSAIVTTNLATFTVLGEGVTQYRYKFGFSHLVNCQSPDSYTNPVPVVAPIALSLGLGDGVYKICLVGGTASDVWQGFDKPLTYTWKLDSIAPTLNFVSPMQGDYLRYERMSSHPIEVSCTEAELDVVVTATSVVTSATVSGNATCVGGKAVAQLNLSTFPDGDVKLKATQIDASSNTGNANEITVGKSSEFQIVDIVFNASATSLQLEWGIRGHYFPLFYDLAYTVSPTAAPADCSQGTVVQNIPGSDITQTLLPNLTPTSLYQIRVCPHDPSGLIMESKAAYIEAYLGDGNSRIITLHNEPNPGGAAKGSPFGSASTFVGDTNADGFDDVVYHDHAAQFRVLAGGSNAKILTIAMTSKQIWKTGDINSDGKADYVLSSPASNSVRIADAASGALLLTIPPPSGVTSFGTEVMSFGDYDSDGKDDYWISSLVTGLNLKRYYIISGAAGAVLAQIESPNSTDRFQIYDIGDFNGDGQNDYALLDGRNITVKSRSGAVVQDFPNFFESQWQYSDLFEIGDINGDGKVEIAAKGIIEDLPKIKIISSATITDRQMVFRGSSINDFGSYLWVIPDQNADGIKDYFYSDNLEKTAILYSLIDGKTGVTMGAITTGPGAFKKRRGDYNNDGVLDFLIGVIVYSIHNAF